MYLFILPTYGCNLNCSYCYENKDKKLNLLDVKNPQIKIDFKKYFEFSKEKGFQTKFTRNLNLHGGEPTLLPAEDILLLADIWTQTYDEVFKTSRPKTNNGAISIVTNAIKLIQDREYFERLISSRYTISLGISFDMYSQETRSPNTSYRDFEDFFDYAFTKEKVQAGLLVQITQHSLEHEKEWLQYFEYFTRKYQNKMKASRIVLVNSTTDLLREKKFSRLFKKIREIENKLCLEGVFLPWVFYFKHFDLNPSETIGTCGGEKTLCLNNTYTHLGMLCYYNNKFWFTCPGKTRDSAFSFTEFEEYPRILRSFYKKDFEERSKICNGCVFFNSCSPCVYDLAKNNRVTLFDGVACKKLNSWKIRK